MHDETLVGFSGHSLKKHVEPSQLVDTVIPGASVGTLREVGATESVGRIVGADVPKVGAGVS